MEFREASNVAKNVQFLHEHTGSCSHVRCYFAYFICLGVKFNFLRIEIYCREGNKLHITVYRVGNYLLVFR